MFEVEWGTVIAGLVLGLTLGAAIVGFLVYAVVNTAKNHAQRERDIAEGWLHAPHYEKQRVLVHARAHDPEAIDW